MTGEHKLETSTPTTSFLCGCRVDSIDNNILIHKEERYLNIKCGFKKGSCQVPVSIIGAGAVLIVVAIVATWIYKKCR